MALARIKKTVEDIKIGAQQAEIRLNPADLAAIVLQDGQCLQIGSLYLMKI